MLIKRTECLAYKEFSTISIRLSIGMLLIICMLLYMANALCESCVCKTDSGECASKTCYEGTFSGWSWAFLDVDKEETIVVPFHIPDIYEKFVGRFRENGEVKLPENNTGKDLSQEEANWILKEAGVSLGDEYILYIPEEQKICRCHLVGVRDAVSGTGVPLECFALELRPEQHLGYKTKDHARPIGIVKAKLTNSFLRSAMFLFNPNDPQYTGAFALANKMTGEGAGLVELDDHAFLYDRVNPAILFKHHTDGLTCLGCVVSEEGVWKPVKFVGDIYIDNGMVRIEDMNAENDLGMYETMYTVLNDINGNGFVEIFGPFRVSCG